MCAIDSILQEKDMAVPRKPRELCDWVNSKASELSRTDEGKRYSRSGTRLPKKFWEEIRPLCLYAKLRYGLHDNVKCMPNLENSPYDAVIMFCGESSCPVYVEFTYAKDGYDESLRNEVLTREGSVNLLGEISQSGTKASGRRTLTVAGEAVKHDDVRKRALDIVRERILGKSGKEYGKNHILVIIIDDYVSFYADEDKQRLKRFARSVIKDANLDFKGVALLGASGNYLACIYGEI
jgi:hypothetical protein